MRSETRRSRPGQLTRYGRRAERGQSHYRVRFTQLTCASQGALAAGEQLNTFMHASP